MAYQPDTGAGVINPVATASDPAPGPQSPKKKHKGFMHGLGEFLQQLLPHMGETEYEKSFHAKPADAAAAGGQSGEDLLNQMLGNYSSQMQASGISGDEIRQALTGEGFDLSKKGLKASDIMGALTPLGLQSNLAYKLSHPNPINAPQMQQLLQTISGYQKPFLDTMQAGANYGTSLMGDFAKFLSPRSQAAYGDLSHAYQNQAKTLANVIPAENPAAILGMISGGGTTAPATSGLAGLMAQAGVNPATLTPARP